MMLFKKKLPNRKIGISQNEHYFCIITNKNQDVKVEWYQKSQFLLDDVLTQIEEKKINTYKIFAINDQFIWRKYCFFPKDYSNAMLYRQIIEILKQELPISIEEIYFDYQVFLQDNSDLNKVIIYALIKNNQVSINRDDMTILDSEVFCYKRGLDYLFHLDENPNNAEIGYFFKNSIIQFKPQAYCQTLIENETQMTDCKRLYFLKNLQKTPNITSCESICLSIGNTQEIQDYELYITALGATLWNGKV